MKEDYKILAEHCEAVLLLNNTKLPEEFYYQSLSLCVLDAVFSIGVKYSNVQNVISNFILLKSYEEVGRWKLEVCCW